MKKRISGILRDRKAIYLLRQKDYLLCADADRAFYKTVKSYGTAEKPAPFDIRTLYPGRTDWLSTSIPSVTNSHR